MASPVHDRQSTNEPNRPAKRARTDDYENTPDRYRTRSPPRRPRRGAYNGPSVDRAYHRHAGDSYRPSDNYHRRHQRQRSASPGRTINQEPDGQPKNKKTTKDRKENPSTRIRSLRNLLARGGLPATVQQEKERELAALLFDQQKEVIKQGARKNLKRYHFIRFVERQKATRTLKKLRKLREAGDASEDLENKIHQAEVDLNYCLYCPLAQKYIAIYAREDSTDGKVHALARNLSSMRRDDYAVLSDDQKHQLEEASMEAANTVNMADRTAKPPIWYVVEAKMREGQKALENLRDEQPKVDSMSELVVGLGVKQAPDWLNDDGMIDPGDLDIDSDEENGGVAVNTGNEDDVMSDGDGGFFEKR